jgi:DNA-binding transcriptional regulator YdaS (Cro superfamily)
MKDETIAQQALLKLVEYFGSQKEFAEKLGLQQGQVSMWINRDKKPPLNRVNDIIKISNHLVDKYDLRPDIYGKRPTPSSLIIEGIKLFMHGANFKKIFKLILMLLSAIFLAIALYFISDLIPQDTNIRSIDDLKECTTCALQDACLL